MMEFSLQAEVPKLHGDMYEIPDEVHVGQLDSAIDDAVDALAGSSEAITHPGTFVTFRSALKHASEMSGTQLSKILDTLSSAFQNELDATYRDGQNVEDLTAYRSHQQALELYAYLLVWFVQTAEKRIAAAQGKIDDGESQPAGKKKAVTKRVKTSKGKGVESTGFDWPAAVPQVLALLSKALRIKTERIWQTTAERDAFISCFMQSVNQIAANDTHMKSGDIRLACYKIWCLATKNHGQALTMQTMIEQNITAHDHLAEPMAELVAVLAKEFDYARLGEDVLRTIAGKDFPGGSSTDAKLQKPFPRFLTRLSELLPRLVHKQMVTLQKQLDSESHTMRMALLEVIGNLIKDLATVEDPEDPEQHKRDMENLFALMFDRFLDLNGFVRARVVATFSRIMEIKTNRFAETRLKLTGLTVRSLEDKTSTVRKNCISLLVKLILTHPYGALHGGELDRAKFEEGYEHVCKELRPLETPSRDVLAAMAESQEPPADDEAEANVAVAKVEPTSDGELEEASGQDDNEDDDDSSDDEETRAERSAKRASAKAKQKARKIRTTGRRSTLAIEQASHAFAQVDQDKLNKLRLTKRYYADALLFITEVEKAVPQCEKLLASKAKSEVLESMEFFRTAYEYGIDPAESGVKRMLHLVWSKDNSTVEDGQELKGIRSRLIECYRSLYFDPLRDMTPQENVNRITKNMIQLTFGATLAELTSLEQLMNILMTEGAIHDDVIARLWQAYSSSKDIPREQRRGAIIVLGMLATAKPEVASAHLDLLLKIGLGQHGKSDYVLARYSCLALRRIGGSQKKIKGALQDQDVRLSMDNPIFQRLKEAIENPAVDQEWFGLAEQALDTIYALGEQPDALCSAVINDLATRIFEQQAETRRSDTSTPAPPEPLEAETGMTESDETELLAPAGERSQLADTQPRSEAPPTSSSADTANAFQLAQLLFAAGHIAVKHLLHLELLEREFKRRKAETEKKDVAKSADREELDQVVGSVEDDIADIIAASKEKELMYGPQSLLSIFGPMSVAICSQPKVYKNRTLRVAAVSAMSKFMCVSAQFCEDHLMLLFKILETTSDPIVRSNIIIALGDIAVCFSTLMDQNSDRLYAGLTDRDLTVKKNTLMVLTHLILNGMIKVKGQLGEMAKCLEDEESRISDLAKLFFEELATKENAIYNNLPDIISHLSIGKHAVDEETYQSIMKYIFRYIEKERQADSIVEKLCQRFKMVSEERQWRDIAFCMSLLPFRSEKSVKKLVEGLPSYQDKLKEETVYRLFVEILNKARLNKATKNEGDLAEFERALEDHKKLGQENAAIEQKAQRKTRKRAAPARGPNRGRKQASSTPPSSPEP